MHMEHAKAVLDACHLKQDQHVLMVSGRAAWVKTLKTNTILFAYFCTDKPQPEDFIEIPRHRIPEFVRVV